MATSGVSYESKMEYRADETNRIYLRETTEYSDGEVSVDDRHLSTEEAALVARSANLHYKLLAALKAINKAYRGNFDEKQERTSGEAWKMVCDAIDAAEQS